MDYDCVGKIARFSHFVGALMLFAMAILKFTQMNFTNSEFVIDIYYILFGILIVLIEFGIQKVIDQFYFMNYSFGKALFSGFIATLCYGTSYWAQLIVAIFFTVACAGFLLLGFMFNSQEQQNVQKSPDPAKPEEAKAKEMDNNKLPAPQV